MKFTVVSHIRGISPGEVYSVFDHELLLALSPPFAKPVTEIYEGNQTGSRLQLLLKTPLGTKRWTGKVTEEQHSETEIYFVDEGVETPFGITRWRHKHRLLKTHDGTQIRDEVQFDTKNSLLNLLLFPVIWLQLLYRKPLYAKTIRKRLAAEAETPS